MHPFGMHCGDMPESGKSIANLNSLRSEKKGKGKNTNIPFQSSYC